jgi:hypothetical protein
VNDHLLTAHTIGREFAMQLQARLGGLMPTVSCELVERPDAFGPARVLEVRWGEYVAHLQPARTARLSVDDYSRLFVQPQVEAWVAAEQQMARWLRVV